MRFLLKMKSLILLPVCLFVIILNNIALGNAEGERENMPSPSVSVKDSTQYSARFIADLKRCFKDFKKVSLIDDAIIIDDNPQNALKIPTGIPPNTETEFKSEEKGTQYSLKIRRINYSTLEYAYSEKTPGGNETKLAGNADLNIEFYLNMLNAPAGANLVNGMDEYADNSANGCWTYIGISMKNFEKSFIMQGCDEIKVSSPELSRAK